MENHSTQLSMLIVEDEHRLREMMAYALEEYGYRVMQAADGETAIEMLTHNGTAGTEYAVVITDLVMGDIDGVEVMNVARDQPNAPEVILLTGHGSLETAISAVDQGAFAYLLKPCPPNQLRERVSAAVARRAARLRQQDKIHAWERLATVVAELQEAEAPAPLMQLVGSHQVVSNAANQVVPAEPSPAAAEATARYLHIGKLCIDTHRHEVMFHNQTVHVTPIEYRILQRLADTPEQAVTFRDLIYCTHEQEMERNEARELLVWHIRNLRTKLDRDYLVSVRSVGYMLVDPERSAQA